MAYTWSDYFISPYTQTGWAIADSRAYQVKNSAGTNVSNSTSFDYFSDTSIVGDTFSVGCQTKFWEIKVNVATPLVATAIEIVWEYTTSYTAWSTLKVENQNPFLSSGEQIVRFTPPVDWYNSASFGGYAIRAKISSVTGLTEGGANGTSVVLINIKPIRTTGTETSLASALTGDLAGSYTILTATTPAASLTPLEMSVLALGVSTSLDVTLSGCTLGAGDTVTLTGTDIEGVALVEVIDVSGGNATYTSTHHFQNITDISCTFSDGTIAVTQNRWGVIQRNINVSTLLTYTLNSHLQIGDGSTTTTTTLSGYDLYFQWGFYWMTEAGGTFNCGSASGNYSVGGTRFFTSAHRTDYLYWRLDRGIINHRACTYSTTYGGTQFGWFTLRGGTNASFYDCVWVTNGSGQIRTSSASPLFQRCRLYGVSLWASATFGTGSTDIASSGALSVEYNTTGGTMVLDEVVFSSIKCWMYRGQLLVVNSDLLPANFSLGHGTTDANALKIVKTIDLKVVDSSGSGIEGASVLIKSTQGTTFLDTTTDSSGDVAQTQLWYATGDTSGDPGTKINGYNWTYYNPYTLTITKSGYQTKTMVLTMDRKREEIVVLEKAIKFITAGGDPLLWNLSAADGQNKHKWSKV